MYPPTKYFLVFHLTYAGEAAEGHQRDPEDNKEVRGGQRAIH